MAEELTPSNVERTLTWAYNQALSSHGPIDGAIELADSYRGRHWLPQKGRKCSDSMANGQGGGIGLYHGASGPTGDARYPSCELDQCAIHSDAHDCGHSPLRQATTSTRIA